jgi:iron complex transport system permease protein
VQTPKEQTVRVEATLNKALLKPSLSTARTRARTALIGLALLLALSALFALTQGAVPIPFSAVLRWATDGTADQAHTAALLGLRLPRILLAVEVGAVLAVAGLVLQALFRNPIADALLLGTSSGAALGAVSAIVLQTTVLRSLEGPFAVSLAGFLGGLVATAATQRLGDAGRRADVGRLLLAGIAVNAVCWAGVGFLTYLATDAQLRSITFWNLGSLAGATWPSVAAASAPMLIGLLLMVREVRALNLLLLGEREAGHLGVDVKRLERRVVLATALAVGSAVASVGVIGFIGLVVPALLRLVLGPDVGRLAWPTAFAGGSLLVLADLIARTAVVPAELPVGLLTSALGAPLFAAQLARKGGES